MGTENLFERNLKRVNAEESSDNDAVINNAESIDALTEAIKAQSIFIEGADDITTTEELVSMIEDVRKGRKKIESLPEEHGLRAKVEELVNLERN